MSDKIENSPSIGVPANDKSASAGTLSYAGPKAVSAAKGVLSLEAWSPLKIPLFRTIWGTSLLANTGIWMREAAAPWMMGLLSSSTVMVSLMQSASSAPLAIFAIPAGVLSDMYDRRKMLAITQIWVVISAIVLGLTIYSGRATPQLLLGLTFIMQIGVAFSQPPFQAIVPELVPPSEMPWAVALNAVMLNLSRAMGPAIAGTIMGSFPKAKITHGIGWTFFLMACCFCPLIFSLFMWKRPQQKQSQPEKIGDAVKASFRYLRNSKPLWAVQLRVIIFISCAVCLWGLIPKIVKNQLHGEAGSQGLVMTFLGLGAVIGVFVMPELQRRLSIDGMVAICTVLYGGGLIVLSTISKVWIACPVMAFIGFAWVVVPTNFNIATQRSVPNWIKGRALGVYTMALWGTWAICSPIWGGVAGRFDTSTALFRAGCGVIIGVVAAAIFKLTYAVGMDFTSAKQPAPAEPANIEALKTKPFWITVAYKIGSANASRANSVLSDLRQQRIRNGATDWRFKYFSDQQQLTEIFQVPNWTSMLRHVDRTTNADLVLQEKMASLQIAESGQPVIAFETTAPFDGDKKEINIDTFFQGMSRAAVDFTTRLDSAAESDTYRKPWQRKTDESK